MNLRVLIITSLTVLMNIVKYVWIPLVYALRNRSREVVYNYWLNNGIAYLLPSDIKLANLIIDNISIKVYTNQQDNSEKYFLIKNEDISKYQYYWYLYLIWVWFDDTLSADIIGSNIAVKIMESPYLKKIYSKELNTICRAGNGPSFKCYNINNLNDTDIPISIILLSLLYNDNNNLNNYKL